MILEQKVVNYAIYTKVYYAEIYQFAQDLLHQCKKKTLKKWMFQDKSIIKTIVEANNIHYIQTSCKTIDKQDIIII